MHRAIPNHAAVVAKAFYEGRSCKRSNAETDGVYYRLHGNSIACRNPDYDITQHVAAKLCGDAYTPRLQARWAGWITPTTERHLNALGIHAYKGRKGVPPQFFGREVTEDEWIDIDAIHDQPLWQPAPKRSRTVFVNLTPELDFASC